MLTFLRLISRRIRIRGLPHMVLLLQPYVDLPFPLVNHVVSTVTDTWCCCCSHTWTCHFRWRTAWSLSCLTHGVVAAVHGPSVSAGEPRGLYHGVVVAAVRRPFVSTGEPRGLYHGVVAAVRKTSVSTGEPRGLHHD
jgi:hypothetical protein